MIAPTDLNSEWVYRDPQANSYPENFCTKLPFFEKKTAIILKNFFNGQSQESYFQDQINNRWGLKKAEKYKRHRKVSFDLNGRVTKENISLCYSHYQDYEVFQKIVVIALEKFAATMGWKNETHKMALSFMQHQLFSGSETAGIEFHRDDSYYTAVIMLDDAKDEVTGWNGGDLLFRSLELPNRKHLVEPECGYGILFSNNGTQHAVTPMNRRTPTKEPVDRTIFTIHEYGILCGFALSK